MLKNEEVEFQGKIFFLEKANAHQIIEENAHQVNEENAFQVRKGEQNNAQRKGKGNSHVYKFNSFLHYFLRWPTIVTAKNKDRGANSITHGANSITHGTNSITHGKFNNSRQIQ